MAGGFSVTPSSLSNLAGILQTVSDNLNTFQSGEQEAENAVAGNGRSYPNFDAGPFQIAGDVLNSFISNWSNGVNFVQSGVQTVAKALNDAASAYSQNETQLNNALSGKKS